LVSTIHMCIDIAGCIGSEELCAAERELERERRESAIQEEAWLERERIAQEQFSKQRAHEEKITREREDREVW